MQKSKRLVVFSGAGLSADSGIPTFRSADGLWENHKISQVCDMSTWKANRIAVHRFYNDRRAQLERVAPNAMHRLLADWQERFGALLITQNVDDLLERAGARDVLHVHGTLREMRCLACGTVWGIGTAAWDVEVDRCPKCRSLKGVKPNVVFFGEAAPNYRPMGKALESLGADDVLVVIGTDGAVIPIGKIAASLPCRKALQILEPVPADRWTPGMVAPALFHHTLFGRAAEQAETLDATVTEWMS